MGRHDLCDVGKATKSRRVQNSVSIVFGWTSVLVIRLIDPTLIAKRDEGRAGQDRSDARQAYWGLDVASRTR